MDPLIQVFEADCLSILSDIRGVSLVYTDPPFNTGKERVDKSGTYEDSWPSREEYLGWLLPRLSAAWGCLHPLGSLIVHLDYRQAPYVRVALDRLFGESRFQNEIVWAYDYGGRPAKRWPAKHDTLLWYTKSDTDWTFNLDASDRLPYMAPALVGAEKAERGKTPTDVWWNTIVPTQGKERVGYPTQKPLGIVRRIVSVHSNPGDIVLDCFAGSGTLGVAAKELGRHCILVDKSPLAIACIRQRLRQT